MAVMHDVRGDFKTVVHVLSMVECVVGKLANTPWEERNGKNGLADYV